ncbi:putative bicoid mrna stability factor [Operophtera brumata]|uniref:Putative bicoid mrna stability factor n=1 Tax=Operophtera brumata TaxID=104452 RepID=A0A0L7LVL3_OPEBR|nr:putative bicoid mrna stability factor [Operophtera brumata]
MSSLLRSTKFVRYFTGAARTLLLNSAKTAETNLLTNSKALCAANNVLMRDYATKKAENLEPLLQKLDLEVRRYGRITKKDIDEVFDEIRSRNDITSSQSLLVIRCCGELVPEELPEQRTLLVQKIWSILTERGIPMDISHYNALLRGDVEGATKVLEKMRELNFPVSEPVLNALVMGHAFHGDTDGAKAVLETMARAGLQPTNRTYTLLACGFAKKGDIEGVHGIIKLASEKDAIITDKDVLEMIEHLASGGHEDKVEQLFPHLQKHQGYNQDVLNLILRLLNKGHLETAKKMLPTMPKSANVEDTPFKGAFFIKQLLRVGKSADEIIKTCLELKEEGLIPNAIYIATENALIQGRTEVAQKLLTEYEKEGHEVRPHFYWPLLAQKVKENDEEGLLQIVKEMQAKNITVTGESLRDYVIPYLLKKGSPQVVISKLQFANVAAIHSSRNVVVELLDTGRIKEAADIAIRYRTRGNIALISRPLLNALSKTKDVNSFVSILHVVSSKAQNSEDDTMDDNQTEDTDANVSRIVISAVKIVSKDNTCEELLSGLHSKGLRITIEAAESIEQYLGESMTTTMSELLSLLTSLQLEIAPVQSRRDGPPRNSDQLEKLIETLKGREGKNVARLQKQLLSTYMDENNVEKLNSYVEELKSASDFELTVSSYAQLYEFYCVNDDIEKAKECHAKIVEKSPEFMLNRYKLVLMASALVKTMTDTLITHNYIEPSNVILGPLIKVHLKNDDLDSALDEFENLQEHSVEGRADEGADYEGGRDQAAIHGEVNILHDLVLAFVECGRLRQARRILETPGLQTRHRRLDDACLRYVEEGKSEYLEGLLEATKELSHIDRSNIFYHLLVTYCKSDETDKALGLWTLLQEEGEVPSDQFLVLLGKHLRSKRRDVPFVIPNEQPRKPRKENVIDKVIQKRTAPKPTKEDVSTSIETSIQNGQLTQAMDLALKSIQDGVTPKPSVLKYLLKSLGQEGNVEKIQQFGKLITEVMKKKVTYNDKLTLAIFVRGAGPQHIDGLYQSVQAAQSDEDLEAALRKFPRSKIAAAKGHLTPANLLWMEYLLAGKKEHADSLWKQCLQNADVIVFRRLLQESYVQKDPQMIVKLIEYLKTNKSLSLASVGNAYSRLISYHLTETNIEQAEKVLEDAVKSGVQSEHLNKTCLIRLKGAVEAAGREFTEVADFICVGWQTRGPGDLRQLLTANFGHKIDDLLNVIQNESGRPTNRFSLRLSSQLMRGLVRLYEKQVNICLNELCMINANVAKHANKKYNITGEVQRTPRPRQQVTEQLPQDGFGEENPEVALQLLAERTMELMMMAPGGGESAAQLSMLQLAQDGADRSHDKSRLAPDHRPMERVSDRDLTMLDKSTFTIISLNIS